MTKKQWLAEVRELVLNKDYYSNKDYYNFDKENLRNYLNNYKTIIQEWNNCNFLKMFEIEAFNEITGEEDYIVYNIHFSKKDATFWSRSIDSNNKIILEIDSFFSLDSNLESFLELCNYDIIESDDYNLR